MDDQNEGIYYQEHHIISFPNPQDNKPEFEDMLGKVVTEFDAMMTNMIAKHKAKISFGGQTEMVVRTHIDALDFTFKASRMGNSFLFMRYDTVKLNQAQIAQDNREGRSFLLNLKRFENAYMRAEVDKRENYIFTKDIVASCFEKVLENFRRHHIAESIVTSNSMFF